MYNISTPICLLTLCQPLSFIITVSNKIETSICISLESELVPHVHGGVEKDVGIFLLKMEERKQQLSSVEFHAKSCKSCACHIHEQIP